MSKNSTSKKGVSKKVFFGWPTLTISTSIAAVLFGYATYYATDILKLSAVTIGIIFMISAADPGIPGCKTRSRTYRELNLY